MIYVHMRVKCIATLAIVCGLATVNAQTGGTPIAKVQQIVAGSGYKFEHPKAGAWIIPAKGPAKGDYQVFVAVSGDIVVIGAVVAQKAQMPATAAFDQILLHANHDMDYVKIGLDGDGDAFVRVEIGARILDAVEFKKIMDQVTAATDALYTRIKSYLK